MVKKENKKWKVILSKEANTKVDEMPDEVYDKFTKILQGFKTGKLDPTKAGTPIDWVKLDIKLKCPECESDNVEWLLDKNSNEVTFHCLKCPERFWVTYNEYKKAVKENPDKIVNL